MSIETELKTLVSLYASYDAEQQNYVSNLNKDRLLRLDADVISMLNKSLLKDGPAKEKIRKNYRTMAVLFHPDHRSVFGPEVVWLEHNLSEGQNNGACFKTLMLCYEKLNSPPTVKPIEFGDISTSEDFKKWLENLKNNSRTYTERNFYNSLLDLFNESTAYFDEAGKIKASGLRALVSFLPMVFISFGTFVFAEELFAVYALYFALLKSGQFLEGNQFKELQKLGGTLQKISAVIAIATTTLLVRLLEMTFWASRQFYETSLQLGSSLLTPILGASTPFSPEEPDELSICTELVLASQNQTAIENFSTPELKMIAAPIESCLGLLEQQFFKSWRAGGTKSRSLEAFLLHLRVIDKDDDLDIEEKINKAAAKLLLVKKDVAVYSGKTAIAVDRADRVIRLLIGNMSRQQSYSHD